MNKVVLFIEDYLAHFNLFSTIMSNSGFYVYPQKIENQTALYNFLHSNTNDYNTLKNNIFNYIITEKLYDKISMLIIDINLLKKDGGEQDKSGKQLFSDFRKDFYAFYKDKKGENTKYERWSESIPVIALTKFDKDECNKFETQYGNAAGALNKDDVIGENNILIAKMNNALNFIDAVKEQNSKPTQTTQINTSGGDYVAGKQTKTTGNSSPIIKRDNNTVTISDNNIVKSEIELENILKNHNVTQDDIKELLLILRAERAVPNNYTLIPKMKNWWNKVKSYVRDLSVEMLGSALGSLLLSEQVQLLINILQ